MANWVPITANSHNEGGFANLDTAYAVAVVPTFADPDVYCVVVYQNEGGEFDTVITDPQSFPSAPDALDAARGILNRSTVLA